MFNCHELSQKVSESMDRVMSFHQQMMIRFHLQMGKYCERFRGQLLLTRRAIRMGEDSDEKLKPSNFFSEPRVRIKQTLRAQLDL